MKVDVLILGGGIAGLWLLAELRAKGIQAVLATDELGKGQTIASQGIIHGGTKYALTGKLTGATLAIGNMPRLWKQALHGEGAVDLRQVKVLTETQLLWTSAGIGSRLTGFFASKAMKSRMDAVPDKDYPELFKHKAFHGGLYQLDEPVLDIPSVLTAFQQNLADYLIGIDTQQSKLVNHGQDYAYQAVLPTGETLTIQAEKIILAAGAGNEALLQDANLTTPAMQRRPLQMVMLRGHLPCLYAHALGMSDKPRLTISSHTDQDGQTVWYIGGQPAEQGVGKPAQAVIQSAQQELSDLLPWLDLSQTQWATWQVDRAELKQADGSRPDQPAIESVRNLMVTWPTKLAFAPMVANQVLQRLPSFAGNAESLPTFPLPPVAKPVWNQVSWITY